MNTTSSVNNSSNNSNNNNTSSNNNNSINDLIDLPSFSLVEASKFGQLRECIAYIEKIRLQSPTADLSLIVNSPDESGNTALHWACYKKHYEIVKYLISMGGNPNQPNNEEGQTPFHWACIGGHPFIVKYVLNNGGDVQLQDRRGYSSLIHATQYGEVKVVRYLLEKGVTVTGRDSLGQTALHWAAYQGHVQMILFLVNKGAELDALDSYGRTPLHWACYKGHKDPIKALADFGGNLLLKDNNGDTPVDLCRQQNHTYLAKTLSIYPFHPLRKLKAIPYNLFWILTTIGIFSSFAFELYYFTLIPSILVLFLIVGFFKFVIEPLLLPYTPNPMLPTWMICSFTAWALYYIKFILPAFPDSIYSHIFAFTSLSLYYYYAFKLFFSDPGTISSYTEDQDTKDFLEAVENELKVPEVCTTCLINKPVRSRHCRTCKRCVARFDHHCGWINNCVGVGNNLDFIILLALFTVTYTTSLIFDLNYLALTEDAPSALSIFKWLYFHYAENKGLLVLLLYKTLIMGWIGRLFYVQVTGVFNNVTMFELMRPPTPTGENQKKCCSNNTHGHNHKKDDTPSPSASSSDNSSESESSSSIRDAILMPKRNTSSTNPYHRGSRKENIKEFIYETGKWFRLQSSYSLNNIDF